MCENRRARLQRSMDKYQVVFNNFNWNRRKFAQKYLETGWVPQGGVSISVCKHGYDEYYTLTQAMVKVEK